MANRAVAAALMLASMVATGCNRQPVAEAPATSASPAPEGFIDVPGGKVFYQTMGGGDRTPLLLLHGGPGGRSCGFAVLADLATDRRVIRYDQLGSGRSDRPDDLSLWRTERFVQELDALRTALGLREVHILGHSWGGTLATEYLLTRGQQGVRSVILSSPLISTPRWLEDTRRLRGTLPTPVQAALNKCEAVETADQPACVAANEVFEEHFVRGAKSLPPVPECEGITGGDQVYRHMWGAGEFTATGLLRDYDRSNRLNELKLPVLFLAGRRDEAAPETIADFQRRVPGAQMKVFENSAHSTYRTETAEYVRTVRAFLDEVEGRSAPPSQTAAATFVNKVWAVSESKSVAIGTLYAFLSDGTLVITSANSKPALGRWTRNNEGLTMVEESIEYKVDILSLTATEFKIRSHNPGGFVDVTLSPAGGH